MENQKIIMHRPKANDRLNQLRPSPQIRFDRLYYIIKYSTDNIHCMDGCFHFEYTILRILYFWSVREWDFVVYFPRSVVTLSGWIGSNIRGWATKAFSILPYRLVNSLYQSTVVFNPSSHDISSVQPSSCNLEELIVYRKSLNWRSGTYVMYSSSLSSSPKIFNKVLATLTLETSLSPPILYTWPGSPLCLLEKKKRKKNN